MLLSRRRPSLTMVSKIFEFVKYLPGVKLTGPDLLESYREIK